MKKELTYEQFKQSLEQLEELMPEEEEGGKADEELDEADDDEVDEDDDEALLEEIFEELKNPKTGRWVGWLGGWVRRSG